MADPDQEAFDRLLLALAHDARAHLRRSLTGVQMVERAAAARLTLEQREHLSAAIAASKELERLFGRLSDFANAGRGLPGKPLPLRAVLAGLPLRFPACDLRVGEVPEALSGVRTPPAVMRAIEELTDNALRFSGRGPVEISVAAREAPGSAAGGAAGTVEVTVRDHGLGLDERERAEAFEPLRRFHARDQFPGAGLGLAICRRLARSAAATVRLMPAEGGGLAATITFPAG